MDLVAPLFAGAQLPSRDHQRMPTCRRHRRDVHLAQVHSRDGSSGQRWWQRLPRLQRQAELVVIRPPGHFGPAHISSLVLRRQQRQQRRALATGGQVEHSVGQHLQRLILPDHRLVRFGVVRILRLELSSFRYLLPPQFRSCLHVGGDFLAQRLDALAVQGVLPAFGRLLELPCAKSPPLRAHGRGG